MKNIYTILHKVMNTGKWLFMAALVCVLSINKVNAQCAGTYTITITACGFYDESHFEIRNAANVVVFTSAATGTFTYVASGTAPNNGPFTFFIETQGNFNDNCANYTVICGGNSLVSGQITGGQQFTSPSFCCGGPPPPAACAGVYTVTITACGFWDESHFEIRNASNAVVFTSPLTGTFTYTASGTAPNNGPFTFFIETQGNFNDNCANYSVVCSGTTLVSGQITGGTTFTSTPFCCATTPPPPTGCAGTYTVTITACGFWDESHFEIRNASNQVVFQSAATGTFTYVASGTAPNNGPFTFFAETQGVFNDNCANYTVSCSGTTLVSGQITGGTTFTSTPFCCAPPPPTPQCAGTYTVTITSCGFWDESHFEIRNASNAVVFQSAATGTFTYVASGLAPNNGPFTFFIETQGNFNDNCANYTVSCSGTTLVSGQITGGLTFTSPTFCCAAPPSCAGTYTTTITACGFYDESHFEIRNPSNQVVFQSATTGTFTYVASGVAPNIGPFTFFIETQGNFNDNCANYSVTCTGSTLVSGQITGGQQFTSTPFCCGPPPPCGNVASLAGTTIGTTTAAFSWTAVAGATSYQWELRTSGGCGSGATGLVSSGSVATNALSLTGLNPSTAYTLCVRSVCPAGNGNYASLAFSTSCTSCPGGSTLEVEACGGDINGGCNATPVPVFQNITVPATVCGTAFTFLGPLGQTRDTDWYLFTVTTPSVYTMNLQSSDFTGLIGFIAQPCPQGAFMTSATSLECGSATVSAVLAPGNYVAFVATSVFTGYPCGNKNNYRFTLTSAPFVDPCSIALPISCGSSVSGTTVGATPSLLPAPCLGDFNTNPSGKWYIFNTPNPGGGVITLTTCNAGTNYDTYLKVFTGTCASLTCFAFNDDDGACTTGPGTPNFKSTLTFTAAANTNYYVYVTGFGTATGAFTLNTSCVLCGTPPVAGIASGPASGCTGGELTYTVSGANAIQWQVSTTSASGPFTDIPGAYAATLNYSGAGSAGTYYFRNMAISPGCGDDFSNVVTTTVISSGGALAITASPNPVCPGATLTLNGSFTNPGTVTITISSPSFLDEVEWTVTGGFSGGPYFSSPNTVTIAPSSPFTFSINSQGNFNDNTPTYTVFCNATSTMLASGTLLAGTVYTSGPLSCAGAPLSLNNPSWIGPGGYTATGLSPSFIATPTSGGTYTFSGNAANGCLVSASVTINLNPLPVPDATNDSPVCDGTSLNLFGDNFGTGGQTSTNWQWTGPVGSGYSANGQNQSLSPTLPNGAGTYTLTVTNNFGCTESATTTVALNPNPTLGSSVLNAVCPGDLNGCIYITSGGATAPYLFDGGSIGSNTTGTFCGLGAGSYSVTVSDDNNCQSTIQATVIEEDLVAPTITCPPTVTVNSNPGVCYATGVALGTPVFGDNCAGATVSNNTTPTYQYPVGGTFVQWEVSDLSENKTSCNQLVIVQDLEPPVAICKNLCVYLNSGGLATITGADINNGSTDNCSIASVTASPNSFSYANAGSNVVTLTVTDINGNTSTCTATVTIGEFYTIFGSTGNCTANPGGPAGCLVNISSGSTVNGNVGSYRLIQTGSTVTINGKVVSGGKVDFGSGTTSGSVSAANNYGQSTTIFSAGSGAQILGDIDVLGDININPSGSAVTGTVRHPAGTTYTGPVPGGGVLIAAPILPPLPGMPITHTYTCGGANVTGTATLNPGSYGNLNPGSGSIITFHGPGNYYFSDINLSQGGGSRTFKYDFMNLPGTINIYVCSNIHLGGSFQSQWANPNTPDGCRVYFEVQGNGGTNIGSGSNFNGRMWAPYGGINVGSGSGTVTVTGSLWSAKKVDFSGTVIVNRCASPCPPGPRIGDEVSTTDDMGEMLQVYPNPTTGKTTVKFFADAPYGYTLKVIDYLGRIVLSNESKAEAGDNTQEIDMSQFAKGLYLIEVGNAEHSQKVKVVVQ